MKNAKEPWRLGPKPHDPPRGRWGKITRPIHNFNERVYNLIFDAPARGASYLLTGKQKQFRLWISVPAMMAIYGLEMAPVSIGVTYLMVKGKQKEFENKIAEDPQGWDDLVDYDYRYVSIRDDLRSGKITREESRDLAAKLQVSLNLYFETLDSLFETHKGYDKDLIEWCMDQPVMSAIKKLKLEGMELPNGVRLPVSDEQLAALVILQNELFLNMAVARAYILNEDMAKYERLPGVGEFVREQIEGDANVRDLRKFSREREIKAQSRSEKGFLDPKALERKLRVIRLELMSWVQEDLFWKAQIGTKKDGKKVNGFDDILQVVRARDGEPLTLTQKRKEAAAKIFKQVEEEDR
jgi:hypothetical protein